MIGLMFAQAAYNGWIALHIDRIADGHVYGVARAATLLDLLTVIILMTLLALPQIQCAPYIFMMLEAVAYDGVAAAVASVVLFAGGLVVIGLGRNALYHAPLNGWEAFFWFLLVVAAAVLFPVVSEVLLERETDDVPLTATPGSLSPRPTPVHLSVREQEVLKLVANGCSNTMIASRLHLRESTVKSYVESTLSRLGARTRAEAVATASRLNLL
jgi:DNA-binding CsgD family transcriptional regulator